MKMFDDEMTEKAKSASTAEELNDDELDNVAGGACSQEDGEPKCPNCGTVLTSVNYCDGVDPRTYSYKLCYGCGSCGYYYSGDGWTKLPENRVQYLIAETSK